MLSQSVATVRRIELQHLERPQAILEQLKQSYCKKHRVGIEEVSWDVVSIFLCKFDSSFCCLACLKSKMKQVILGMLLRDTKGKGHVCFYQRENE